MSSSTPQVRRLLLQDEERVAQLWMALHREQESLDGQFALADDAPERFHNDYPEWLELEDYVLLGTERDDELVGFAVAYIWYPPPVEDTGREVYIDWLYVEPDVRRQGHGKALFDAVYGWARQEEARRIRVGVLAENQEALTFWQEQGAHEYVKTLTVDVGT